MKTAHGTDSQGRSWIVTLAMDGQVDLTPNGHTTDPESADLSDADEFALIALVDDEESDGDCDTDGYLYDRRRDAYEDARMGVR